MSDNELLHRISDGVLMIFLLLIIAFVFCLPLLIRALCRLDKESKKDKGRKDAPK